MASLTALSAEESWRVTGFAKPAPETCTETLVGLNAAVATPAVPPVTVLVTALPVALPGHCEVPHQGVGHLVARLHLESRGAGAERQLLMAVLVCVHGGHDAGALQRRICLRGAVAGIGDGSVDRRHQAAGVADAAQVYRNRDLAVVRESGTCKIKRRVAHFCLGIAATWRTQYPQPSCRCSTQCRYPCRSGRPCR